MKLTTKATFSLAILWFSLSSTIKNPSNPPTGSTGAPGELTCAQSGCHNGGAFTGSVALTGVPDTVIANTTYTLTLTNTSTAPRAGFQLVCLNATNVQCGTLTAGTGSAVETANGKQYICQSTPKLLSAGATSWTFTWKAPATLSNNAITFYFTSLAANGNGGTSGDNVLKSMKTVVFKSTTSSKEVNKTIAVNVFPNPTKEVLNIDLADVANAQMTMTDLNGRILLIKQLTEKTSKINIAHLSKGYYNVQIQADGKSVSKKIVID